MVDPIARRQFGKPTRRVQPREVGLPGETAPANPCELLDSCARAADALGQATFIEAKGEFIGCGRCEIRQAVVQLENKRCGHQGAERNRWIAPLKPPGRIAAGNKSAPVQGRWSR